MITVPAGSIIKTFDDIIFYAIAESLEVRGVIAYVPDRECLKDLKYKTFGGKVYRKAFGSSMNQLKAILDLYPQYVIEKGWNCLLKIEPDVILSMNNPQEIAQKMRDVLHLDQLRDLFGSSVKDIGIGGSVGIEFVPSQVHDIDIFFYGKEVAPSVWNTIKECTQTNPLFKDGKFYMSRFNFQGYWYCVHMVPNDNENTLRNMEIRYIKDISLHDKVIATTLDSFVTPTIVELQSGLKLISYKPSHAALFNVGDILSVDNCDLVKVITMMNNFDAVLLTKHQWVKILS